MYLVHGWQMFQIKFSMAFKKLKWIKWTQFRLSPRFVHLVWLCSWFYSKHTRICIKNITAIIKDNLSPRWRDMSQMVHTFVYKWFRISIKFDVLWVSKPAKLLSNPNNHGLFISEGSLFSFRSQNSNTVVHMSVCEIGTTCQTRCDSDCCCRNIHIFIQMVHSLMGNVAGQYTMILCVQRAGPQVNVFYNRSIIILQSKHQHLMARWTNLERSMLQICLPSFYRYSIS